MNKWISTLTVAHVTAARPIHMSTHPEKQQQARVSSWAIEDYAAKAKSKALMMGGINQSLPGPQLDNLETFKGER